MNTQEVYINLLTDFGFKKLFGVEANKDLLIDLELIIRYKKMADSKSTASHFF